MRPSILHVGGVLYWTIQTRNPDTMVLKDADSTPSVAVRKNGASVGDSVTITKRSATTGIYDCSYNPAAEVEGDAFQFEESAAVTGTTTSSATYVNQFGVRVRALERGTDGALQPTVAGRTLNVNTSGEGGAVLNTGALLNALGLEAGNLDEQLADILAASGGGGGGGGLTEEQTALLVSIARWAARNNGGPMHYTGNVGDGGVLELTINDDHETAIENDLPIVVKDPDGLLHAKLTASGATLSWSAGQDNVGGLITGTVTAPTHDEDTALTTIVVQVPNCTASGNITAPYQWQLKRTLGGKIKTELRGTLRINPDMS